MVWLDFRMMIRVLKHVYDIFRHGNFTFSSSGGSGHRAFVLWLSGLKVVIPPLGNRSALRDKCIQHGLNAGDIVAVGLKAFGRLT